MSLYSEFNLSEFGVEQEELEKLHAELAEAEGGSTRVLDLRPEAAGRLLQKDRVAEFLKKSRKFVFLMLIKTEESDPLHKGTVLVGTFAGHYPTVTDTAQISNLLTRFTGGAKIEAIEEFAYNLFDRTAHCLVCLDHVPAWFPKDTNSEEPNLFYAVGGEVLKHLGRFPGIF